jgi:hypothetical protein
MISEVVETELGERIARWLFCQASTGLVFGVALVDGTRIVIKTLPSWTDRRFLHHARIAQSAMVERGFPGPEPLSAVLHCGRGYAVIDTMLSPRHTKIGSRRETREALAFGLHEFAVAIADQRMSKSKHRRLIDADSPWALREGQNTPFRPRDERLWLSNLAWKARERMSDDRPHVLVHTDWRIENVLVSAGRIVAIYDWDSLGHVSETSIVGQAAMFHPIHWRTRHRVATPFGFTSFVDSYEQARGARFSRDERESIAGWGVYRLCELARHYQHADPRGRRTRNDGVRSVAKEIGEEYFEVIARRV